MAIIRYAAIMLTNQMGISRMYSTDVPGENTHVPTLKIPPMINRTMRDSRDAIDRVIHAPARLMVLTYLYVVEHADFVFLMRLTGLTWGNLSSHISKLEESGYVAVEKKFVGKKPLSIARLTKEGREAFRKYKLSLQQVLNDLPD